MAVVYKKIIAIKSVSYAQPYGGPQASLAYGQTYELESTLATEFITDGFAIDYATALSNPKCPPIIRTKAIRIG
ncbi:hypothetical protein [Bacillus thuringiensis]|uniref:hypothetical protein n=1 Tax=Bacillus thuringiensis TaxID=1428 RepID=UPI000BF95360|nr:hypothetical protein [Bacillus thuringiensis]MED3681823.1 hypothetical protein [Bacillus thuringiensis]PFT17932.1 hypothetical protein COK84_07705 [Bacillus thuringiensis]